MIERDEVITKNLLQIREYTKENEELSKSHHFLYNCPINKNSNLAEVIIVGINPGETSTDWIYEGDLPTEESSEFDFHEKIGRGSSSKRWIRLCEKYSKTKNIVLTEFFFWSSPQVGEDEKKEKFSERFGYRFEDCPHFEFCRDRNIELINLLKPKIIICPGVGCSDLFSRIYNLNYIGTFRCSEDKRNRRAIIHYELNKVPFVFTLHWSNAMVSKEETSFMIDYIEKITK